jgi:hypothetical protein
MRSALLAALGCSAVACSSDPNHGPPVGAPNVPVVIGEGGGTGGGANVGQGAADNAGNTSVPGLAGSLNAMGGSTFSDPSAGSANFGSPSVAGNSSDPPFGAGGTASTFGGSSF